MFKKVKHPLSTIIFFGLFLLQTLIYRHPVYIVFLFLFTLLMSATVDSNQLKKNMGFYLYLGLAVFLINPLINRAGSTELLQLFGLRISLEGVSYGLFNALSLITVLILFTCLNSLVPPDKLTTYLFRAAPKMSLIISMAFSFIPLFQERMVEIKQSLFSRGLFRQEKGFLKSFKDNLLLLKLVLFCGLEDSIYFAVSMECRGYGRKKRSVYETYECELADYYLILIGIIQLILIIIGVKFGFHNYQYYPHLEQIFFRGGQFYHFTVLILSFMALVAGEVGSRIWDLVDYRM